jgi:uncharacterized protein YndB with AHSA1/START domain
MSDEVRFEREIAAPPEAVFAAFTSQGGQEAFYRPPGWIVESVCDLRIGGEWIIDFGPSKEHLTRHTHRFRVIEPPRRLLVLTTEHRTDGSRFTFTTEFTFAEIDAGTLMTMIQTGIPTAELRGEHERGEPDSFTRFESVLRSIGPFPR